MTELDAMARTKLIPIIDSLLDLYTEEDACEEINALVHQRIQMRVERFAQANLKSDLYPAIQRYIAAKYYSEENEDFFEGDIDYFAELATNYIDAITKKTMAPRFKPSNRKGSQKDPE